MIVSLNEIESTAARAVRGCGHPEGIAEEAGFAVRWLCERELPGLAVLVAALDGGVPAGTAVETDVDHEQHRLRIRAGIDGLPSALPLAPSIVELAMAGPAVSADPAPWSIALDTLWCPLLLAPFVARNGSGRLTAAWATPRGPVVVEPSAHGVRIRVEQGSSLGATTGREVLVGPSGSAGPPTVITSADLEAAARRSVAGGCRVDEALWTLLGRVAGRTHVPVSEESRLRGAGAGLTDND